MPKSQILSKIEEILISLLLLGMIILVLIQVILRDFFYKGIMGADELIRHIIIWIAFLGADCATIEDKHIQIDILSKIFPEKLNQIINTIIQLFSAFICGILSFTSIQFVFAEYKTKTALAFFNIPIWIIQLIIPISFILITIRFIHKAVSKAKTK